MSKTEIPPEYQDCVLSPALESIFESNPDWQSLLMIGPAGTGKTTQMFALADKLHGTGKYNKEVSDWVMIISECMDISRHWKNYEALSEWIEWHGILCVDDIGYAKPTEWCRDAVYAIATERRKHGLQTIWSTNLNLEQLAEAYSPAIASRLQGGEVLDTAGEDKRQKFINSPTSVQKRREAREEQEAKEEARLQAKADAKQEEIDKEYYRRLAYVNCSEFFFELADKFIESKGWTDMSEEDIGFIDWRMKKALLNAKLRNTRTALLEGKVSMTDHSSVMYGIDLQKYVRDLKIHLKGVEIKWPEPLAKYEGVGA